MMRWQTVVIISVGLACLALLPLSADLLVQARGGTLDADTNATPLFDHRIQPLYRGYFPIVPDRLSSVDITAKFPVSGSDPAGDFEGLSVNFREVNLQRETLAPWSPGVLDIHHINTGKGDSALFIFPDGTSLLVDAGASLRPPPRITPQRPDSSRTPGEWIARYARRMLGPAKSLDYVLLTHFHGDHMGDFSAELKDSASGRYKLTGITEVGEHIPIANVIDRAWPDYNYPSPLSNPMVDNYRSFLKWHIESSGMQVRRFLPGRNDQVVLTHEPLNYANFEIRNVAGNGEIWTGLASNTRQYFPPLESLPQADWPTENMCSIAFRLSYGKFDYFSGGDMPGLPDEGSPAWHDVETPVAGVVGPVEVHVLNHHGFHDSANAFFLSTLRPRVHIMSVYAPSHPGHRVLDRLLSSRLYPGPRDVFATNMMEATKVVIGTALARLRSDRGHILVRVDPGGDTYRVIVLDDSAESYEVKSIHGPYESK